MPDSRRARCVVCKRHRDEVGPLSWSGLCAEHSVQILVESNLQISQKRGPAHRRRLHGYLKWLEREALDVQRTNP